ncbi:MAG: hypothetical protein ACFE85_14725 [Candidatus Hodarchaeota archaeon]
MESYRFLIRNGLIKEAENVYNQWIALAEIAEIFGIDFESISAIDKTKKQKKLSCLTKNQLEKIIVLLYKHFIKYRLLTVGEFDKILKNIIENE